MNRGTKDTASEKSKIEKRQVMENLKLPLGRIKDRRKGLECLGLILRKIQFVPKPDSGENKVKVTGCEIPPTASWKTKEKDAGCHSKDGEKLIKTLMVRKKERQQGVENLKLTWGE